MTQGPGEYDPDFKAVLKRTDIYGAKMAPLTEHNDRLLVMDLAKKDAVDALITPVYTLVEKRAPEAVIKGPVDRIEPPQIPDKLLYPEHWEFYDPNLKAIKPNTELGGKFAAEDYLTFKLKDHERDMLRQYLQLQHRVPEPGYYDPVFALLEQGVPIPSFDRYLERSRMMTKSELMHREIDGDVLVLNPDQVPSKGGNLVDYGKMPGRPEPVVDQLAEVLDLKLNYNQVEKRPQGQLDMVDRFNSEKTARERYRLRYKRKRRSPQRST